MTTFFLSYTAPDKSWAEWIAWTLEEAGHTAILQAWDFRPGHNFLLQMQDAAAQADRTIAVLSPAYLQSQFAAPEWAAALREDAQGLRRRLIPVRIAPVEASGLLGSLVYVDLVGLDEAAARRVLLDGGTERRSKPATPPRFPGHMASAPHPDFPGQTPPARSAAPMPKLRGTVTDQDRRRLMRDTFAGIRHYFQEALATLRQTHPHLDAELEDVTAHKFLAQVYANGRSKARAKIWLGTMISSDGIGYFEGHGFGPDNDGSYNEMLSPKEVDGDLYLQAMMSGFAGLPRDTGFSPERMTPDQAAEYLWRRFMTQLER